MDGAQVGISFTPDGELWLQSRGHYLVGGSANEAQYGIVKAWATTHRTGSATIGCWITSGWNGASCISG